MGMGFGTGMIGSPMVIMWANSDGSVTLSQRQATEHAMPNVVDAPPRVAALEKDLTTASGDKIQFAFSIPSDGNANPPIIWAFGDKNPNSSAVDATLARHLDKGKTSLSFAATTGGNSTNGNSNNGTTTGNGAQNSALGLFPGHELVVVSALIFGLVVTV
ncbi:hypothetical protein VNI00_005827 [Paramarasmius palmivorus]|uniref:DOMON domain-containing protein n=1 Tax=Paramarasmius palmivorus TaxID=297713 RepID=A0AAW0DE35_9AGAR